MSDDPIRITGLTKKFRWTPVLKGIELAVPQGAVFALIGPNGAGKTTTIKILMNILRPTSGHAEILGMESRCLPGRSPPGRRIRAQPGVHRPLSMRRWFRH